MCTAEQMGSRQLGERYQGKRPRPACACPLSLLWPFAPLHRKSHHVLLAPSEKDLTNDKLCLSGFEIKDPKSYFVTIHVV
jgi:hypothetical protein